MATDLSKKAAAGTDDAAICVVCGREELTTPSRPGQCLRAKVELLYGSGPQAATCYRLGYAREQRDRFALFLALRGLVMAVTEEANAARSISGDMGARLTDARAALRAAGEVAINARGQSATSARWLP